MLKIMHKNKNCAYSLFSLSMCKICVNKSLHTAGNLERLFYKGVNCSKYTVFPTVQLEYINHMLKHFFCVQVVYSDSEDSDSLL